MHMSRRPWIEGLQYFSRQGSMETISNPGSPARASTPILGDNYDGIFLEDSLIGEGNSEEERRVETNLEASWRKEARKVLHAFWQEENEITTKAEEEAAKYRKLAAEIVKNAKKKENFLMNGSLAMIKTAETQAKRIKHDATMWYQPLGGLIESNNRVQWLIQYI